MTSETSELSGRILALEGLLNGYYARLNSFQAQLAQLQQETTKAWGQAAGGGSSSAVSPAVAGAGGVPAGGSANVTLQVLSGGALGAGGSLTAGQTVVCNNNSANAVGANKAMQVGRDQNGNYWALSWDC